MFGNNEYRKLHSITQSIALLYIIVKPNPVHTIKLVFITDL